MNADQVAREVPDYGAHVAEQLAPILAEGRDDLELEITALQELNQRLFRLAAGISSWSTHLLLSETYSHSISRLNRMMNLNRQNLQSAQPHWLKDLHKIAAQLVEWGELQPQELENFPWGSTAASPSPYQSADTILQENIARLRFMMRKAYENAHRLKDPADLMRMIDGYGLMGIKLAHLLELKSSAGDNLESLRERAIHEALKR
ncbi:MAG: hypothetical protein IBX69_03970 [Anaerolineales bacterium]|nr:hypothetical protein [Anaerolineales bacterium]